jgi:hypothetical protein
MLWARMVYRRGHAGGHALICLLQANFVPEQAEGERVRGGFDSRDVKIRFPRWLKKWN